MEESGKMANNNAEFFEALQLLQKEKGIDGDYLLEKIRAAIVLAVKKDYGGKENIAVIMEPSTGEFSVSLRKTVVEEVLDPDEEMLPEEAVRYSKKAKVGDVVEIKLETKQFGRIAAQTAKHVIRQGIREAERGQKFLEFQRHNQELVTALVTRVDPKTGAATVEIIHPRRQSGMIMHKGLKILFRSPGITPLRRLKVALSALSTAFSGSIITASARASLRKLSLSGISGVSTAPKYALVMLTPVFCDSIRSSRE